MYYIVIREKKDQDTPAVSEVVRNAYLSNVFPSWQNAFFSEVTFQMIIVISALLFIVLGVPLSYCLVSIPIVLVGTYILIYGTVLMKVAQLLYEKKELKCWVAEAYEPLFFSNNPKGCWYKILTEAEFQNQEKPEGCRRKVTFQMIIVISALLFIVLGVPLSYCLVSIPIVLVGTYILIYGTVLMKVAQLLYEKKELKCWVAEAYEPLFFSNNPKGCWYKILTEAEFQNQEKPEGCRRKIIGTVSVMKHFQRDDWAWLYRLAVDKSYRRKGVGLKLVRIVQEWCRDNKFNNIELVVTECHEGPRQLFDDAGFEVRQLYHKKLFTSAVTLQMFQLRCAVRPVF